MTGPKELDGGIAQSGRVPDPQSGDSGSSPAAFTKSFRDSYNRLGLRLGLRRAIVAGLIDYESAHGKLNLSSHDSLAKRIAGHALACFDRQFHKLFGEEAFDPLGTDGGDAAVDLLEETEKIKLGKEVIARLARERDRELDRAEKAEARVQKLEAEQDGWISEAMLRQEKITDLEAQAAELRKLFPNPSFLREVADYIQNTRSHWARDLKTDANLIEKALS